MSTLALRSLTNSPRRILWLSMGCVVALAWVYLATFDNAIRALCTPNSLSATPGSAILVFSIWLAMALAMMLPAAFPMISAYLDIAEAARSKKIGIVAPIVFVSGYVLIWTGFAAAITLVQLAAAPWLADPPPTLAGAALFLTGAYQFSSFRHSCLSKCRAPMSYFLSHWSDRAGNVFRMGLEQGAACLGCCWCLMALGLVAGLMNLAWMAAIAVIAILERTLPEPRPITYGCGFGLLGAGLFLALFG